MWQKIWIALLKKGAPKPERPWLGTVGEQHIYSFNAVIK